MAVLFRSRLLCVFALAFVSQLAWHGAASAQVPLYYEDFQDETIATNGATLAATATIADGVLNVLDESATQRGRFSVVQDLNAVEILTFSFDVRAPVVELNGAAMELLIRVGTGTAQNTMSSTEDIIESIAFRSGNRGAYTNNGNESIFVVANNKATDLTFTSPVDAQPVTLTGFQYVSYVRNNAVTENQWGIVTAISNFQDGNAAEAGNGTLSRFGIGTSSNAHQGSFKLDNVLVTAGVNFAGVDLGTPGDVDGDDDVDIDDFNIIRDHFQKDVTMRTDGDLTGDNFVNFLDYRQWKSNASAEVLAQAADLPVPEPASAALLAIAGLALCAARNRRARA